MKLLSVDPGSKVVGYAVFHDGELIVCGEISTEGVEYEMRYLYIINGLAQIFKENPVDEFVTESVVQFEGKRIPELEVAYTSIRKWAEKMFPANRVYTVHPSTWKAGFIGQPNSTKEQVARVVYLLHPELRDLSDHVTDAIGIGEYHWGWRRLELMTQGVVQDGG